MPTTPDDRPELTLTSTADGTRTLHCPVADQTYHSTHGALAEARHVFLEGSDTAQRLAEGLATHVLEIGLGTGLNLAVTLAEAARTRTPLRYTAVELRPLPPPLLDALAHDAILPPDLRNPFRQLLSGLHDAPQGSVLRERWRPPHPDVDITLVRDDARSALPCLDIHVDAIYLDAFSPSACPELWETDFLAALRRVSVPEAVLATYSCAGAVRRALVNAGWTPRKRPGPPGGKREVLRATRP
ncbi:MAG: hypothetical protein EA398_16540 [Deltaproteobacteria bacterium]|nr:MAG: hypothetical protein EA398_16540 [Deltaproteobacteria bacterium]